MYTYSDHETRSDHPDHVLSGSSRSDSDSAMDHILIGSHWCLDLDKTPITVSCPDQSIELSVLDS